MHRLLRAACALLCLVSAAAHAQMMIVTGNHLTDSAQTPVANATMFWAPVANSGGALSYKLGGAAGGQVVGTPVQTTVTAGVFSITLPDVAQTAASNVCFSVTLQDNESGNWLPFTGHTCVQPSSATAQNYWCTTSSTCNFDLYVPATPAQTATTAGPAGQSAYQVAVANGYTGTQAQWLASLVGAPGADGTTTLAQVATAIGAATTDVNARLAYSRNLWNPASTLIAGRLDGTVNGSGHSNVITDAAWFHTPPIYVAGQTTLTSTLEYLTGCGAAVTTENDATGAQIGTLSGCVNSAPSTITLMPGTVSIQVNVVHDEPAATAPQNIQVVAGSALPASAPSYGLLTSHEFLATLSATVQAASAPLLAHSGIPVNLFDPRSVLTPGTLEPGGAIVTGGANFVSPYVYVGAYQGQSLISNLEAFAPCGGNETAFYDLNYNRIGAYNVSCPSPNVNGPLAIPVGAVWMRFNVYNNDPAGSSTLNPAAIWITPGTTPPTVTPQFFTTPITPWFGKKFAVIGDSYSYANVWQPALAVALGMTQTFEDGRVNRPWGSNIAEDGIFECYQDDPIAGKNQGAALSPGGGGWGTCAMANNGTVGNTLTQDLAAANPDLILIALGTNPNGFSALGSMADSAGTNSTYGYIKTGLNGVHAAKPLNTRVVCVEPVQVGDSSVANSTTGQSRAQMMPETAAAIDAVCASYGDPVIHLWSESGINSYNWASTMQSGYIHLLNLGWYNYYIPTLVNGLKRINPTTLPAY